MAPPFYSKNGCANRFSRMGQILLRAHFDCVWPGEAQERFDAWWAHAEAFGLCYSFECVVPRILGDHGATPSSAYVVLTCVAHVGGGGFLSPLDVLALATTWRMPLNEAWYVPWAEAAGLEDALHAARWTMGDADADSLLAGGGLTQGFLKQGFLPHGETQGEVLEGFVLMAVDAPVDALALLVEAYEGEMAPHRDAALARSRSIATACLTADAALVGALETDGQREPRRAAMRESEAWQLACSGDDADPMVRLFRLLRGLYAHRVRLKSYEYGGAVQVQVDVGDDQVFFGWKLHTAVTGCAPLFRGMVVQFDGKESPPLECALVPPAGRPAAPRGATGARTRVIGIAKLKCLRYLQRTFGVRNMLPLLLDKGPTAYLEGVERFFKTWGVPPPHRETTGPLLAGFAAEVQMM